VSLAGGSCRAGARTERSYLTLRRMASLCRPK
jgi:hypothetical protein